VLNLMILDFPTANSRNIIVLMNH